jgi:hypothetical protein
MTRDKNIPYHFSYSNIAIQGLKRYEVYHSKTILQYFKSLPPPYLVMKFLINPVRRNVPVTISLPLDFLSKLDSRNPGMHRSKFVLEIFRDYLETPGAGLEK